jgi:hypothetical protein
MEAPSIELRDLLEAHLQTEETQVIPAFDQLPAPQVFEIIQEMRARRGAR